MPVCNSCETQMVATPKKRVWRCVNRTCDEFDLNQRVNPAVQVPICALCGTRHTIDVHCPPVEEASVIICSNCKEETTDDAMSCPNCSAPLFPSEPKQERPVCPSCAHLLDTEGECRNQACILCKVVDRTLDRPVNSLHCPYCEQPANHMNLCETIGCSNLGNAVPSKQAVKGTTGAETIALRESVYGPFAVHAKAEQEMKRAMTSQPGWENLNDLQKSAAEMIVHKLARILNNSADYADNWHDIAGYATLAEQDLESKTEI